MEGTPGNDCCSICHGNFHIPCQANCSHWFCGNCILQVWNYGSAFQPCRCPLCRRQITLLIPSDVSSLQRSNSDVAEILGKIERYNRHFGARSNGLIQRLRDLPFLLKRLLREILNPQRSIPFAIRARVCLAILASALYIISPVDIIPEAIFGIIGFVDDALIAVIGFLHVAALYRSVLLSRYGGS
ncbi:RING-type E3 ubiquitin transferase [Sarracenia purpurea var. burkii]